MALKLAEYKGHKMSNSLNAFLFYKKRTGRTLEGDSLRLVSIKALQDKLANDKLDELSPEEINQLANADLVTTVSNMYCAFRQAGDEEVRKLSFEDIIDKDELTMEDIQSQELLDVLMSLLNSKN